MASSMYMYQASVGCIDLVVELVGPGSDDLLKVVVAELAVVEGIVPEVKSSPSDWAWYTGSSPCR